MLFYSPLLQCCANVSSVGPALKQRWTNSGLYYFTFEYWSIVKLRRTRVLRRCWLRDGPTSWTLVCRFARTGSMQVYSLEHHHIRAYIDMPTFSHLVCTPHFYTYLSYKLTNKPQGLGTEIKLIKLLFLLYFVLVSIINELNWIEQYIEITNIHNTHGLLQIINIDKICMGKLPCHNKICLVFRICYHRFRHFAL